MADRRRLIVRYFGLDAPRAFGSKAPRVYLTPDGRWVPYDFGGTVSGTPIWWGGLVLPGWLELLARAKALEALPDAIGVNEVFVPTFDIVSGAAESLRQKAIIGQLFSLDLSLPEQT